MGSREPRGKVCEKITGFYCKPTTISSTYAAKGAFTKGRGAEGRKMQKNFAIAKISEGRGEKEVSGLFVRGECGVGAGGGRMRGAHRLPTFWGRNERGDGGWRGGRHRDRDCDFLKFAVCCDNNDLGEERDGDADGRRKSFQRMHPPRRRVKRGVLSAIRK